MDQSSAIMTGAETLVLWILQFCTTPSAPFSLMPMTKSMVGVVKTRIQGH